MRAEDLVKNPHYKGGFDLVVSRATAYLPIILAWAVPSPSKN